MNREQLRDEVAFLLNFNEDQADQDFTTAQLNRAIQYAYQDEVRQAKLEGQMRHFKKTTSVTWTASTPTLTVPSTLQGKALIALWDVTNADPGTRLIVRDNSYEGGDVFWLDNSTLQWGSDGPSSDTTVRFEYMAEPETLISDAEEPQLMPISHHWLIVWSAAIYLRTVADEGAPQAWLAKQREFRLGFWKWLSRGKPYSDIPSVSNSLGNEGDFYYY